MSAEMTVDQLTETMKQAQWEKVKGELRALAAMYGYDEERWALIDKAVERAIKNLEDNHFG